MSGESQAFAPAIIRCMELGIRPSQAEIDDVAARIWSEIEPSEAPWDQLKEPTGKREDALRCARVALGLPPIAP